MFFPYALSVILLSLALYGLCQVIRDVWKLFFWPEGTKAPRISLLLVVRNLEYRIEGLVRYLLQEVSDDVRLYDIVVVDYESEDLTPDILDRLAVAYPALKVVHLPLTCRPVHEGLSFCQGEMVQILDFVNRLSADQAVAAIRRLACRE